METFVSDLSGNTFSLSERISGKNIQGPVLSIIRETHPGFDNESYCALSELNLFRQKYIADYLAREIGEVSRLKQTVIDALKNKDTLTDKLDDLDAPLSLGQRTADRIAAFGGSWKFIIAFFFFLSCWIGWNINALTRHTFDPYPFILLNLILSCLAALQAPLIMMSQNRKEEKDRERSKKDYMINLKSELEIRILHEKIDHLMIHQQHELIRIQKVQIEMMQDILDRLV